MLTNQVIRSQLHSAISCHLAGIYRCGIAVNAAEILGKVVVNIRDGGHSDSDPITGGIDGVPHKIPAQFSVRGGNGQFIARQNEMVHTNLTVSTLNKHPARPGEELRLYFRCRKRSDIYLLLMRLALRKMGVTIKGNPVGA